MSNNFRKAGLQDLSEIGINPFAVKLVKESFDKCLLPEDLKSPLRFEFDGLRFSLEKVKE